MTTTIPYPDWPHPAGVFDVEEWRDTGRGEGRTRYFAGSSWMIDVGEIHDAIGVHISGMQYRDDGRTRRWIDVSSGLATLTTVQAGALGQALLAANDECRRMQDADDDTYTV